MGLDRRSARSRADYRRSVVVPLLLTISGETFAQSIIQQFYGYSNVSGLGYNVSPLGDANGDGVPDYVATAAKVPAAPPMDPLLVAISGATGSPLFERAFPTAPTGFGGITGMDAGADVTGDGIPDVLFGAGTLSSPAPGIPATPQGGMLIFSGSDGAFLHALQNPGGYAGFGIEPRVLPDLDGDGIAEYLVKAGGTGSSSGYIKCLVHRGGSHTLLYDWTGFQPNDGFCLNIDAIDDLDLDGVPDIAIGAPGADLNGFNTNGAIRVYSGGTGGKLIELYGNQDFSALGQFTALGDVEIDGSPDIAVRHFPSNAVHFLDLATGAEFLRPYVDVNPFGGFAILLDTVTDLDGDGARDVIASSWGADFIQNHNGVVAISSTTGEPLFRMKDPHSYPQQILSDFPKKLRVLGDMDGDGRDEWLIGQSNLIQVSTGFGGVAEVVTLRSLVASEELLSPTTSQKV